MALIRDHDIYDALLISGEALDKGGIEILRAGIVDEKLLITARRVFADPAHWGYVLADITRRLAALYGAETELTEAKVSAAITRAFAKSFRPTAAGLTRKPVQRQPAKSAGPPAKARAKSKPSTKAVRRKSARAKP